ncbi:MAG: aminotransferase class IV [Salinivirgaceae bacterium]|nr:aminotransferase class IV [Salinivirgaceae bacterium]
MYIGINQQYTQYTDYAGAFHNTLALWPGSCVTELLRCNGAMPVMLDEHYDHIMAEVALLNLNLPTFWSKEYLKMQIAGVLRRNKIFQAAKAQVLIVQRVDSDDEVADIIVTGERVGVDVYTDAQRGLSIVVYNPEKSSRKLPIPIISTLAKRYAKANGVDDALLLNEKGFVSTATKSNLFVVKGKQVLTPQLDADDVCDVLRNKVVEAAQKAGLRVSTDVLLLPEDLDVADEIFLVDCINGIRWVVGLGNRRFFHRVSKQLIDYLNIEVFGAKSI